MTDFVMETISLQRGAVNCSETCIGTDKSREREGINLPVARKWSPHCVLNQTLVSAYAPHDPRCNKIQKVYVLSNKSCVLSIKSRR